MSTRVGIELSAVACRVVELEGPAIVPGQPPATRVRSYSVLPPSGPETDRHFASIGRRPVAVVVWGVRSDHRQAVVPNGSYDKMRAEALAAARAAGVDTGGTLADIASASTAIKGANRQPVVLALANADDVSAAIRPLVDARLRIRSVVTPADALLGLARSRKAFAVPGGIEAYVALDATATCVALVRDGSLLGARELPWGYEDGSGAPATSGAAEVLPRRDDLAARLVDELAEFLTSVGAEDKALTQVAICGGLPNLRTMTIPLMERLDVEVETLDSLFGIDVEHLPEPADEFRERGAELRLAWAAAADWRGPINLLRHRRRRSRRAVLARAAVVAGVAAGLGAGWTIQQSNWWQSRASEPVARRTPPPVVPSAPPAPARATPAPRPQVPVVAVSKPPATLPTAPASTPAVAPPPVVTRAPVAAPPVARATPPSTPAATISKPATAPASTPAVAPPPVVTRAPVAAPPVARVTPPSTPAATIPKPATVPASTPTAAPPRVVTREPVAAPPVTRVTPPSTPAVTISKPASGPASAPTAAPPPVVTRAPVAQPPVARVPPLVAVAPVTARPSASTAPPPVGAPGAATALATPVAPPVVRTPAPREEASAPAPVVAPSAVRRPEPLPVPFDAVLGTILYSPDRKLAIVNGRIVGPGDEVNGARIVDITATTVLLRDAQGRLRSLTLGGRTPSAPQ